MGEIELNTIEDVKRLHQIMEDFVDQLIQEGFTPSKSEVDYHVDTSVNKISVEWGLSESD